MEIDNGNPNEASDHCWEKESGIVVDPLGHAQANQERQPDPEAIPFWQRIADIGAQVPSETWKSLPQDFARNGDHYLYGTPRDE